MITEVGTTYASEQASFDAATEALPDLGSSESTPAPAADAAVGTVEPGWPVELFELVHMAAFSALGEKWNLTPEQSRVLGKTGKAAWDKLMPPEQQGVYGAYLAAMGTVVLAKIGVEHIEKVKKQIKAGISGKSKPASTETAPSAAASVSSESPAAESPVSFLSSVADLHEL